MRIVLPCLFTVLALAGCTVPDTPEIISPQYPRLSFIAPPPPIPEEVPVSEDPRKEVWRPGHWSYQNDNFVWVPGEMMARPAPWAVWSPDRWEQHTYGWGFEPGTWQ